MKQLFACSCCKTVHLKVDILLAQRIIGFFVINYPQINAVKKSDHMGDTQAQFVKLITRQFVARLVSAEEDQDPDLRGASVTGRNDGMKSP